MDSQWPLLTVIVMIAFPLAFIVVDIIFAINKRKGDTYSEVLRKAGKKWMPVIMLMCFGMGLLAGHWWW